MKIALILGLLIVSLLIAACESDEPTTGRVPYDFQPYSQPDSQPAASGCGVAKGPNAITIPSPSGWAAA